MIYLKKFNSEKDMNKHIEKMKKKIDYLRDEEEKNKASNGIVYTSYYYDYQNKKGDYKELTIITLTDNKDYYLIYENKGVTPESLLYRLYDIDYIKTFDFKEEYSITNHKNKIKNYKILNIDHFLGYNTNYVEVFKGLKNIENLKNMCIEEYKKII